MARPPPSHLAVPASPALAKFFDEHDPVIDGTAAFITHLDETPVGEKKAFFWTIFLITALEIVVPAWAIYSSRTTLFYLLFLLVDQFIISLPIPRSIKWWDMTKGFIIYWWMSRKWRSTLYHARHYCIPRVLWYRFRPTEVVCRRGIAPGLQAEGLFDFIKSVNLAAHPCYLAPRTSLYTGTLQWVVQPMASFQATELASSGEIPLHMWKTTLWYRNRLKEWEGLQLWTAPTTADGLDSFRDLTTMAYVENFCGFHKLLQTGRTASAD